MRFLSSSFHYPPQLICPHIETQRKGKWAVYLSNEISRYKLRVAKEKLHEVCTVNSPFVSTVGLSQVNNYVNLNNIRQQNENVSCAPSSKDYQLHSNITTMVKCTIVFLLEKHHLHFKQQHGKVCYAMAHLYKGRQPHSNTTKLASSAMGSGQKNTGPSPNNKR